MNETEFIEKWESDKPIYQAWGNYIVDTISKSLIDQGKDLNVFLKIPAKCRVQGQSALTGRIYFFGFVTLFGFSQTAPFSTRSCQTPVKTMTLPKTLSPSARHIVLLRRLVRGANAGNATTCAMSFTSLAECDCLRPDISWLTTC